ncbi:hypothetical protein DA2_3116 [Desulfovibrio sp. A2]|nr:hypothetical protein DA2_3116 [Desulfovibrio sp. A2]
MHIHARAAFSPSAARHFQHGTTAPLSPHTVSRQFMQVFRGISDRTAQPHRDITS